MLLAVRHDEEWIVVNVDFECVCVYDDDVKRCDWLL